MSNNRNINFGPGGTYNESVHHESTQVHGDFVQGDKVIQQDFSQEIMDIQRLLHRFREQYPLDEAINKTAHELVVRSGKSSAGKNKIVALAEYIATNGGIEAGIGKAIELALKLILNL